jgi:hypothetical protein
MRITLLILSTLIALNAHAVKPVTKLYGGMILGVNYPSTITLTKSEATTKTVNAVNYTIPAGTGTLDYNIMGDIGMQFGYRKNSYHYEGEFVYNYNAYNTITVGGYTIESPSESPSFRLSGQTGSALLMFNLYHDMFAQQIPNEPEWVPIIGGGIGIAMVQNSISFYYDDVELEKGNLSYNSFLPVAQFIIGTSYFYDDFTAFAVDLRYMHSTSTTLTATNAIISMNYKLQVITLNLTLNGSL